jgi:hypothetical protein
MPNNTEFYGNYARYLTLTLIDQIIEIIKNKLKDQNLINASEEKIQLRKLIFFFLDFINKILEFNMKEKMKNVTLPYSNVHRKKIYLWQALCVMKKLISHGYLIFLGVFLF